MGQAALTVVGAVIGSFIPGVGTAAGAAIGGAIGGYVFAPDVEGPRLQTGAPRNFDYGWPIRRIKGRRRIQDPFKAWQSPLIEDEHEQDAKGGPQQTTWSYRSHVRYIVGKAGAVAVTRIWVNKVLRWTSLAYASEVALQASAQTDAWGSITFMDGSPAQLPWSVEELYEGAENVTAARGLCCICIESLQHGFSENPPLVEFEVVDQAEVEAGDVLLLVNCNGTPGSSAFVDLSSYAHPLIAENMVHSAAVAAYGSATGAGVIGLPSGNNAGLGTGLGATAATWDTDDSLTIEVNARIDVDPQASINWGVIAFAGGSPRTSILRQDDASPDVKRLGFEIAGQQFFGPNSPGSSTMLPAGQVPLELDYNGTTKLGVLYVNGVEYVRGTYTGPVEGGVITSLRCIDVGSSTGGLIADSVGVDGVRITKRRVRHTSNFTPPTTEPTDDGALYVTPLPRDLADIVAEELQEAGLAPAQFDVSALEGIEVDGWDTVRSARQGIEELMLVYNFDWVCGAQLEARLLGGPSLATFDYAHLGAGVDEADPECFNPERGNDQEVPYKRELAFVNIADDHAVGVVEQSRHVTASAELRRDSVNVAMTSTRAQGVVDTIVARARVEASPATVKVTERHVRTECTDVITIVDEDGTLHRRRIVQDTYSRGIHAFESVADDAQAYRTEGITFDDYTESIVIPLPGTVELVLGDWPLLRDADNVPGGYAAFDLDANARSARLLSSADGTNYQQRLVCTDDAVIGTTADALAAPASPYVWDEVSSFTATLSGTFSSSTREAMQLDRQLNTLAIGAHGRWEIVRARIATLIDSTATTYTYTFRGLIRADYGTEHAMASHEAGDTVVVLRVGFGIRSVEQSISEIGLERYWKAPADGRPSSTASEQLFAFQSERLEPRSPTRPRCARDTSNNAEISMRRRTRFATRAGGPGGSVMPLGEATESYEVDIYADDSFAAVVRTLTDWTLDADGCAVFPYSAAEQTADGFTPGDPLPFRGYQLSALVGRGHELEAVV